MPGRKITTARGALAYIEEHGIVLESARGVVPCLVEAIVGSPVRGSWWSHSEGHRIFGILGAVHDSPDVLRCRLVDDKVTYAHRRVWPGLVKLAPKIGESRLDRHAQEHTASGTHRTLTTAFPRWVPDHVLAAGGKLSVEDAMAMLAPFAP
jgi:hypothetical protein